ncbi:hypothetical protein SISNIDRAFT_53213 [Sistotremastrum niveocremeum HHB9708]|uniref:Uncharacterized protein n=1 Tax=Sistotremastrum niveocremeum HHB9708 TaxID=1314777 RepID=A0A164M6Z3_9AGAM|nr:hypothetical protein SISNIDRAFT_53250 [Sistotremastrum niveocremeum HHB9708]KZS86425.1 hypothetical protein SISNIDRAFT_53213 [Sistotremastrum niveocremeum HHB9708]
MRRHLSPSVSSLICITLSPTPVRLLSGTQTMIVKSHLFFRSQPRHLALQSCKSSAKSAELLSNLFFHSLRSFSCTVHDSHYSKMPRLCPSHCCIS